MNNEYEGQWGPPPAQPYFFAAPPEKDRTLKEAPHIKRQEGHPSECKAFFLTFACLLQCRLRSLLFPHSLGVPAISHIMSQETYSYCEKMSRISIKFITSLRKCLTSPSAALWSDQRLPPGPMQLCSCPVRWRLDRDGCALILQN